MEEDKKNNDEYWERKINIAKSYAKLKGINDYDGKPLEDGENLEN